MKDHDIALPVGTTLDRFIKRKQDDFPYASGELSQLLRDIALAAKIVQREIGRSGLSNVEGAYGARNIQGEDQQKLDVIANIRFKRALKNGGEVCAVISEEEEGIIDLENPNAKYVVSMDPLDGSSNIGVNVSVGTIFSIYRRVTDPKAKFSEKDFFQKGNVQVAAGYVLYGSSTMMVYTTGFGVNGFTYEPSLGEFFLSHQNIKTPKDGKIFSVNEGNTPYFDEGINNYLNYCKTNHYTGRYIGSLVADFHRNLLKGGIYLYPATSSAPSGKLRLLYECNALAFIVEQAGGKASDGQRNIMDIQPTNFHQRVPLFIGSKEMVEKVEGYFLHGYLAK